VFSYFFAIIVLFFSKNDFSGRRIFLICNTRMASIQINTPFNITLDFELAGLHKRIFAYFIDLVVLVIYSWGMRKFLYEVLDVHSSNWYGIDILLVSVPMLLYALITEIVLHGQTLGKKALGMRVMSLEGGEPAVSQYLLRWVTRFFEWPLVFGFVFPGFWIIYQLMVVGFLGIFVVIIIAVSKSNQRLGDLAAGTVVVETKTKTYIHETVFLNIEHKDYAVRFPDVMKLSDRDINSVKSILDTAVKKGDFDLAAMAAAKIKTHLKIETNLSPFDFLDAVMKDYNYLSTK
jgi:uncharacterized RDD family membrane protein YckC